MIDNVGGTDLRARAENGINRVLNCLRSQQAIVVLWEKGCQADLFLYEWVEGNWQPIDHMPANLGRNGVGKAKEGDGKSPAGIFSLATAFGNAPPPEGVKYPYRLVTPQDYWVDDSRSLLYNKWVRFKEGYWKDWDSAECLSEEKTCYRHAVIINYNVTRQPEKGSAIFLHVRAGDDCSTHGCTAVAAENMILILKWLDFAKKPVIIQGALQDLISFPSKQTTTFDMFPDNFISGEDLIPDIVVADHGAPENNFIAQKANNYFTNTAILTHQAALALAKAQRILSESDFSLKISGAYYPQSAIDSRLKQALIPNGHNISLTIAHTSGNSVDVTLIDLKTGQDLDMGGLWGCCRKEELSRANQYLTAAQEENRRILRQVMESCGFKGENEAWWHFALLKHK